jgi:SAM-dependent methyltransferase
MTGFAEQKLGDVLPPRYRVGWRESFERDIAERLRPGIVILDVGSGRHPAILPEHRPANTHYIGLDISSAELSAAGTGAYDEMIVSDAAMMRPDLVGKVDLVVSWQVLEHIKPLEDALSTLHAYLRPGGTLISMFSGKWSIFGVINAVLPQRLAAAIVAKIMRRQVLNIPVFPAYYDRCYDHALRKLTATWDKVEIKPYYRGATYFHFSRTLARMYLLYENVIARASRRNLATHYLLVAQS